MNLAKVVILFYITETMPLQIQVNGTCKCTMVVRNGWSIELAENYMFVPVVVGELTINISSGQYSRKSSWRI